MEERARSAAEASRAKTSDSDSIQQNYLSPGLSGQPVRTVDNSRTFTPNIACQKTATMLEVLVQPSGTGDLGTVRVSRDTDLDGSVDSTSNLPVPVSGICANGVVSCTPGTWDQCAYFRWDVDTARNLKLVQTDMPKLAGCYCINNSCGSNLAWGNMPSVLRDLGGGMIGALTTADPRYGVVQAVVDGPAIRYVGAQSTACTSNPALPQTQYRAKPTAIAADAYASSTANPVFQALKGSAIGTGTALQYRQCTVERQVVVTKAGVDDVLSRVSGGYSTVRNGNSVDWLMGSPSDNTLVGGNCSLFDYKMVLRVGDPSRIVDARLTNIFFDDWIQVRIDGKLVLSDPASWTSNGYPPGACERKQTWYAFPNLDLKPYLTPGDHEIAVRVAVGDHGEVFAQIHAEIDDSCKAFEQVVDQCGTAEGDPQCRLDSELVDGVQTWIGGAQTGLRPLTQTRIMGSSTCPVELTRDFFLKSRTYRCKVDTMPQPDTSRGTYIIDHSTETILADRARQADGSFSTSTRPFALPDRGSVPACEAICKTRAPKRNTEAAVSGVVGAKQNNPTGNDTFYHACDSANQCPAGPGEEIVSACGCLDDFPEAVVMMQTVRLAGADLVCTGSVQ
ncbi:hypothetical protein [Sphingomonas abietis]|uniref:PA14 domain-containing protein n=1 Tax=Sphingomonas abietis TaxID=3012344 RepID=A0ABY7NV51_9SPHN|nr:hypothetical protein [Sphingomonas abietis]WBO24675.1 hypothetical protein PBT88_16515 [Sphingomonas abietis]